MRVNKTLKTKKFTNIIKVKSKMYLEYKCNFCILNFSNRSDRKEHIKTHLKQTCCINCDKTIIEIDGEWYEIKQHTCDNSNIIDSNIDFQKESIKIEDSWITENEKPLEKICILKNQIADTQIVKNPLIKNENIESDDSKQNTRESFLENLTDFNASAKVNTDSNDYEEIIQIDNTNRENKSNTFTCIECNISFSRRHSLKRHRITVHNLDVTVKCHTCCQIFQTKKLYLQHCEEFHKGRPYGCELCEKRFKRNFDLTVHKERHLDINEVTCEVCQKKFKTKFSLVNHFKVHSNTGRFPCNTCNKVFKRAKGLQVHVQAFHEGKIFHKCKICGKNCTSKGNLQVHESTHSTSWSFICSYCGRGFNQKSNLNEHINIHTGEKPFECTVCGKRVTQKRQLLAHMRIHTRERPYKCGIGDCDRAYINFIDLKRHKYSQHGVYINKHVCEICEKIFPEKKLLRKHMEKH